MWLYLYGNKYEVVIAFKYNLSCSSSFIFEDISYSDIMITLCKQFLLKNEKDFRVLSIFPWTRWKETAHAVGRDEDKSTMGHVIDIFIYIFTHIIYAL